METFAIQLVQRNSNDEVTFSSVCENIRSENLKSLSVEITDYCSHFVALCNRSKLAKMPGSTSKSIKKTGTMEISITCLSDETRVSANFKKFGQWVETSTPEQIADIIHGWIEFTQKFAHLWSM
jgi:hypothetical protein